MGVTRPGSDDEGDDRLAARLEENGFHVDRYPLTRIEDPGDPRPLERAARALRRGSYDVLLLTSARAAAALSRALSRSYGEDGEATTGPLRPEGLEVWVVGEATGEAARRAGFPPDRMPGRFVAEGLLEAAEEWGPMPGRRILFPRAAEGRDVLLQGLVRAGAKVTLVEAYRTVEQPDVASGLVGAARAGDLDAVVLTAGSQARVLGREAGGGWPAALPMVAIGPATATAARAAGLPDPVIADPHTFDGVVDALDRIRGGRSNPASARG